MIYDRAALRSESQVLVFFFCCPLLPVFFFCGCWRNKRAADVCCQPASFPVCVPSLICSDVFILRLSVCLQSKSSSLKRKQVPNSLWHHFLLPFSIHSKRRDSAKCKHCSDYCWVNVIINYYFIFCQKEQKLICSYFTLMQHLYMEDRHCQNGYKL